MALVSSTSSLGGLAGGNALARLLVVISGDVSGLERAVGKAQGTLQGFGQQAAPIGSALTRSLTLPILAVGGASAFMATQFAQSMGRVAGLTPILDTTGKSIEEISQDILDLSKTVPTGPVELADALYFAGSAGLDAATAFKVVELSAKGAAIGMGEASDISKVLIFSLNAFASQGLTATEAMDALTVAIREGTAEPEDLAVALGRLLPVAKEAGVTFQEVVGAVASLTNIGFPARVATVALRALFAELLAPTQQATERLRTLGLTAEDVRDALRFQGPIGVFKLLEDAVHGDEDALRDILPQIRGFSAFVGITGDRLQATIGIMEKTTNSAGALGRAFKIISETPGFKFEIALNKLRVAAIEVGNVVLPLLTHLAAVFGDVADRIGDLPGPVQTTLVAFLGLAAALGPALKLLGNMGAFSGAIISGFTQVTTSITAMGLAAFAAYGAFQSLSDGSTSLFSIITLLVGGTLAAFNALRLLQGAATFIGGPFARLGEVLLNISTGGLVGIAAGITALIALFAIARGGANRLAQDIDQMGESLKTAAKSTDTLREALEGIENDDLRQDLIDVARSMGLLDKAAGDVFAQFQAGIGSEFIADLQEIQSRIQELKGPEITIPGVDQLPEFISLVQRAADQGVTLDKVLKANGTSAGELFNVLEQIKGTSSDEVLRSLADEALNLGGSFSEVVSAYASYKQAQLAQIAVQQASSEAVADYAKELGVSTEFLQAHLDAVGVSAVGMDEQVRDSFERTAFGVDENGDKISAKTVELEEAFDEMASKLSESIGEAFAGFEQQDKVEASLDKLLGTFRTNAQAVVNEVANLQSLAARGVPTDVLQFLADQGPGIVAKFVDASDGELRRLVALYQTQLAAVDAEILKEGDHQQGKGVGMVDKFVNGILSNSSLPPQAAAEIVRNTIDAFGRGDISAKGLDLAQRFAQGLGTVKGLSRQQGAAALQSFIQAIQSRDLSSIGAKQAEQIANGLAQAANIPKAKAQELVAKVTDAAKTAAQSLGPFAGKLLTQKYTEGVISEKPGAIAGGKGIAAGGVAGLRAGSEGADDIGRSFGAQFASGVGAETTAAYNAAHAVGAAARRGLQDGLSNSPMFYSYYAGEEYLRQFGEGMKHAAKAMPDFPRPDIYFPLGSLSQGRSDLRRKKNSPLDVDLDVTLDRARTARALDWEYAVRGG